MTEITITYMDKQQERVACNYAKVREGWLEIAVTDNPPHERLFIPAHLIMRVRTKDIDQPVEKKRRENVGNN